MVMIGTVESIGVLQARAPGPFRSTVEIQALRVRVDVPLRNSQRGQLVVVRHPRVLPSSGLMINGFAPVILRKNRTYLFFLTSKKKRGLELGVVEDHKLVEFSRRRVRTRARQLRHLKPMNLLLDLLRDRLTNCTTKCGPTIWTTNQSAAYKQRWVTASGKRRHIRSLIRITRRSADSNTLLAAYTVLGGFDERSVIPRIVRILTAKNAARPHVLSNRVGWLQGFKPAVQIATLQQVVANAQNKGVIAAARFKLRHLRRRKP